MRKFFFIIVHFFILSGCGFKIIELNNFQNFFISKVETTGDKRINYIIRNNLLSTKQDNTKKAVELKIDTKKSKSIKEKNIENETTKYEIKIFINLKFSKPSEIDDIVIIKRREFLVKENHSQTLMSEKKLIDRLSNEISEEIVLYISKI